MAEIRNRPRNPERLVEELEIEAYVNEDGPVSSYMQHYLMKMQRDQGLNLEECRSELRRKSGLYSLADVV